MDPPELPPAHDRDAWDAVIELANLGIVAQLADRGGPGTVSSSEVDGVVLHEVAPAGVPSRLDGRVVLDVHGGGFVFGAGDACKAMARLTAARFQAPVWAVDYRTPPAHPYPAPLDDCMTIYRHAVDELGAEGIIVTGASAGANLAAALVLRARDERLPLPGAVVLLTPAVDLTETGDTFQTLLGIDNVLVSSTAALHELYAGDHDLTDPLLSPLYGDFAKGFPRTFLQSGTRDLLLSSSVRMHRALRNAGVEAELHVFEAMPHGGFQGAPEDDELDAEVRRFVGEVWSG